VTTICKTVQVEATFDLADVSDEELARELRARSMGIEESEIERANELMENVYLEFRQRGDAPQSLRDLVYLGIGRIL
jgi:hypothetical protein